MRAIARWLWNNTTASTPPPVGEHLHKDFLEAHKHFVLVSGERRMLAEVVGKIRASGPAATLGGQAVLMEWRSAARLLGHPGQVNRLDVYLKPGAEREQVRQVART